MPLPLDANTVDQFLNLLEAVIMALQHTHQNTPLAAQHVDNARVQLEAMRAKAAEPMPVTDTPTTTSKKGQ